MAYALMEINVCTHIQKVLQLPNHCAGIILEENVLEETAVIEFTQGYQEANKTGVQIQ